MNGLKVLNFVNGRVLRQLRELLESAAVLPGDLAQCFIHQASRLALDSLRKQLGLREAQVYSNLATHGNTVSASIPILISDYFSGHTLALGSRLVVSGFGVGYSSASVLATK